MSDMMDIGMVLPRLYQIGSNTSIIFMVALGGGVVFLLVVLWRTRMLWQVLLLIHKPKVIFRPSVKPVGTSTTAATDLPTPSRTGSISPSGKETHDQSELLQARSQWERLVEEAQSNDQLAPEQRKGFVEEARKRISEIDNQLKQA